MHKFKLYHLSIIIIFTTGLSLTTYALQYRLVNNWNNQVTFEGGRTEFEFADIDDNGWVDFVSIGTEHQRPRTRYNDLLQRRAGRAVDYRYGR